LPQDVTTRNVIGAGALGGIGFTVSLFVTELAFGDAPFADQARLGVIVGSISAALIGTAICLTDRRPKAASRVVSEDSTARPPLARWPPA
jgi:Na+/H+ antiporter NhaA